MSRTKFFVQRDYSYSMGNMTEVLTGEALAAPKENWIIVDEIEPGLFQVVENSMTSGDYWVQDPVALGFCWWDDEVEDLDAGNSDESQCFGISDHLRWNDVHLTSEELRAPSLDRLREAIGHVAFCAWCPGDI
jgi:hypothetical protein